MLNNTQQTSRPTSLLLPPAAPPPTTYYPPTFQSLITPTTVSSPIVITPNTMKSIEQSILQTLGEDTEPYMMESQNYSGNFVPPLPSSTSTITLINTWQGGQVSSQEEDKVQQEEVPSPVPDKPKKQKKVVKKQQPKKKQDKKVDKKPTEEEERRRIRRERNKLAAARCRKRRVDHTNKLLEETEGLESKKRALQTQITELQVQKEELEFILETHHCVKKIKDTVSVLSDLQNLPVKQDNKLRRPNTLNVGGERTVSVSTPAPPIPINTPSNGIAGLGFEPLCSDWGVSTPTPVDDKVEVSKCSLVTPVNPYKKLQDL